MYSSMILALMATGVVYFGYETISGARDMIGSARRKRLERENYGLLPHFGEMMDRKQVKEILSNTEFHPYILRDGGRELKDIFISEDDKWVCILGGYMPVDMLCGYDSWSNSILSIDGEIIRLPNKHGNLFVKKDIEAFFEDRGNDYVELPERAAENFAAVLNGSKKKLNKADIARARYLWEKENAQKRDAYDFCKYTAVNEDGSINTLFFSMVLSDKEIDETKRAVLTEMVDVKEYLDFSAYKNEFCVCNAVALLSQIKFKAGDVARDFLFKCLGDVDEAYFLMAVQELLEYSDSALSGKIEAEARNAIKKNDALYLAGLMFLAEKKHIKIRCVK